MMKTVTDQIRTGQLPPMKIEPFNGDVTTFQRFRNTFTYNVENWTEDPTQRLTHLYNNLQGTPKSLILNCFNVPAEEGYALAWEVLCKHYMKADELCNAFILIYGRKLSVTSQSCDMNL